MKTRGTGRRKRREGWSNRLAIIGITVVVLSLALVVNIKNHSMEKKVMEYQAKEESLTRQVENEQKRAAELEERRVYVQTKQYIEEVAKQKLGLVKARRGFAQTKTKRQLEHTRLEVTDIGSFPAAYIVVQEGIFCVEAKSAPGYG